MKTLQELLNAQNLATLAKKVGCSRSMLSRIKAGHREPSIKLMTKLCKALQVHMVFGKGKRGGEVVK